MFFFLRTISNRHFTGHLLRTALTVLGIALGITVFVGINLVNKSTLASFYEMINNVAGRAQIEISRGRSGFEESVFDRVLEIEGVGLATPLLRSSAYLEDAPQDTIILLGVDTLADKEFRTFTAEDDDAASDMDALQFLNAPDSVLITDVLARRYGLKIDQTVRVITGAGMRELTIRAILEEKGAAKVFGGNLMIMDVFSAQAILDRENRFDQIDIILAAGASREVVIDKLRAELGEGFTIDHPGSRSGQVENMLKSFQQILTIMSLLALFVGMFLIYNTFSMAVAQRRREIGILRALGLSAEQIRNLFIIEATVLGFLGAVVGAVAGFFLARELTTIVAQTISTAYFRLSIDEIALTLVDMAVIVALGVGSSVISAIAPARQAATVSPLEAMRPVSMEATKKQAYFKYFYWGLALFGIQFAGLWAQRYFDNPVIGSASAMLGFLALTLLTPLLIVYAGELFSPLLRKLFSVEGKLGADNLTRSPGRTSVTVSALMIGISLAVAVKGTMLSFESSVLEWLRQSVTADLVIRSSAALPGPDAVDMPEGLGDEIMAGVEGVADVNRFRMINQPYGETQVVLYSVQMPEYRKYSPGIWIQGEADEVYNAVTGQDAVYVSENFMNRFRIKRGDSIDLQTPTGPRTFKVEGVRVDYMSDQGVIGMDRETFKKHWQDSGVDSYDVFIKPGVEASVIRDRVAAQFGAKYHLVLQTNVEYREEVQTAIKQSFRITYVMEIIAILIAIIGIINTLMVSVLDRTRELGMLRAIGFTREQLQKLVMTEAGVMGILAGTFGVLAGVGFAAIITQIILREVIGWTTPFIFPTFSAINGFALAFAVSVLASIYPAWKAAKTNIISALEYE
jgi:putative ABC transport system permease protein